VSSRRSYVERRGAARAARAARRLSIAQTQRLPGPLRFDGERPGAHQPLRPPPRRAENVMAPQVVADASRPASSRSTGCLGSVATPSITSWLRATPSETVGAILQQQPRRAGSRRTPPERATGGPSGYMACLCRGDRQLDQENRRGSREQRRALARRGAGMKSKILGPGNARTHRRTVRVLRLCVCGLRVCSVCASVCVCASTRLCVLRACASSR